MKIVNVYEAKTQLSKLLKMVENGEEVVIAKAGKPIADLKPHRALAHRLVHGSMSGEFEYDDAAFEELDPDIIGMFYGAEDAAAG